MPIYTGSDLAARVNGGFKADDECGRVIATSVMYPLTQSDVDYFRPESKLPTDPQGIIAACVQAYNRFGVVRNVFDMMADFTVRGLDVVNRSASAQKFARDWMAKVAAPVFSERLANLMYLTGVCPVYREVGRLPADRPASKAGRWESPLKPGELPAGYRTMDPRHLMPPVTTDPIRGAAVWGHDDYYVGAYDAVRQGDPTGANLFNPFLHNTQAGLRFYSMTGRHFRLVFFKKHDFEVLPVPLLYPLFRKLQTLDKLEMSEAAVLDGANQAIILWNLGNTEKEIFPNSAAYDRLESMLMDNPGGGVRHILWDDNLKATHIQTNLHQYLGPQKWEATLAAIFQGLGVPPSLSGADPKTGQTNNFVSIKTLVERLEMGQEMVRRFWEMELEIVRQARGYRHPFKVVFDGPGLSDEATEKKLLIDMVDRNLISAEVVVQRFGADPDVERARVNQEERERKRGARAKKAGAFHTDSTHENAVVQKLVDKGVITVKQSGVELEEDDGPTINDLTPEPTPPGGGGNPGDPPSGDKGGRPPGAKDSVKRKDRVIKPVRSAEVALRLTAVDAYRQKLDRQVQTLYLEALGKANLRQLTDAEADALEGICFNALWAADRATEPTPAYLAQLLETAAVPDALMAEYEAAVAAASADGPVPLDRRRQLRSAVVALAG